MTLQEMLTVIEPWWDAHDLLPDKTFEEDGRWGYRDLYIGELGRYKLFFDLNEKHQTLILYFCPILSIETTQSEAVIEFITRANYGIRVGNWEFDVSDRELRYKVSIFFANTHLEAEDLSNAYELGLKSVESYMPGVLAVLEGKEPKHAVTLCEYS